MTKVGQGWLDGDDHVVLSRQNLRAVDFSDRRLEQFSSDGCHFERCLFDNAKIDYASFGAGARQSVYVGCSFDGAHLRMGPGGFARFVDCTFKRTTIENWFCFAVELVNCTFSGHLKKVVFNGSLRPEEVSVAGRTDNQFEGNDFSAASFVDVSFRRGIDLTRQRLPAGDEYFYLPDASRDVRRARILYNAADDPDLKKRARGLLTVMEEDVAEGQRQLLIRVTDYPRASRSAIHGLLTAALKG